MGPVIERIAQRVGDGARPRQELLVGVGVSGAKALFDAVGAHGPPFIVVARQPNLEQIGELPVGGDVLRRKMAVIIEDGFLRGVFMVQAACGFCSQQEIVMDEGHDLIISPWDRPSSCEAAITPALRSSCANASNATSN